MLARTAHEGGRVSAAIAAYAAALGVQSELLEAREVRELAPYLADDVTAALSIPDEGVIDPFWLTRAYAETATSGGADVRLGRAVTGLDVRSDAVLVSLEDGTT